MATLGDYDADLPKLNLSNRQIPIRVKLPDSVRANVAAELVGRAAVFTYVDDAKQRLALPFQNGAYFSRGDSRHTIGATPQSTQPERVSSVTPVGADSVAH